MLCVKTETSIVNNTRLCVSITIVLHKVKTESISQILIRKYCRQRPLKCSLIFFKTMASNKWAGFTDEDIDKLKSNSEPSINSLDQTESKKLPLLKDICNEEVDFNSISLVQLPKDVCYINEMDKSSLESCTCNNGSCEDYSTESSETTDMMSNYTEKSIEQSINLTNLQELEAFELRKKHVEAENARRRALINKAIMDKKQRTEAETIKLSHITEELNRLDSILSGDIVILRDYIEKASRDFSEAEKRYLKAEKEFIEAKFFLFEKMQRKEQLTEHLCAIIEQNENRKANKLVELMKQLEMDTVVEDFEIPETKPILSKYCVMNEEAYHCCQTLKPSYKNQPQVATNNQTSDSKDEASDDESVQAEGEISS